MQVTFLGTSSGVPTRARNVSGVALKLPQRSELWLFDCGEGTQHQFLRSELRVSQLSRIFITHMHGDHIYGLPGLMASLGMAGSCAGLALYGPDPLRQYLEGVLHSSSARIGYPLQVHKVREAAQSGAPIYEDEELLVRCAPLTHRVPAYGYRVETKPRPGRFDVERARALGIPPGPIYAQLKAGRSVTLEDGRIIRGDSLCGPEQPGHSVVYCTDTVFCEAAVELARGADLLIHEATFAEEEAPRAVETGHSTAREAAEVARMAGARRLVLTHISARYSRDARELEREARAVFPETVVAKDGFEVELPLTEETAAEAGSA